MVLLKTNSYSHNHHPLCKKIGYKIITRSYPGGDKLPEIIKQTANSAKITNNPNSVSSNINKNLNNNDKLPAENVIKKQESEEYPEKHYEKNPEIDDNAQKQAFKMQKADMEKSVQTNEQKYSLIKQEKSDNTPQSQIKSHPIMHDGKPLPFNKPSGLLVGINASQYSMNAKDNTAETNNMKLSYNTNAQEPKQKIIENTPEEKCDELLATSKGLIPSTIEITNDPIKTQEQQKIIDENTVVKVAPGGISYVKKIETVNELKSDNDDCRELSTLYVNKKGEARETVNKKGTTYPLKNKSGIEIKDTCIKHDTHPSEITMDVLLQEMKKRQLIKEDDGHTESTMTTKDGKNITVGKSYNGYKITPLGHAYATNTKNPAPKETDVVPQNLNNKEINVVSPRPTFDDEKPYSLVQTGTQRHVHVAKQGEDGYYYSPGYFTGTKGAHHLSDIRFDFFQQQGNNASSDENNINKSSKDISQKGQGVTEPGNMTRFHPDDVKEMKGGAEYIISIGAKSYFDDRFDALSDKPYIKYNDDGITLEHGLDMCKEHDRRVTQNIPHPESQEQIKINKIAKQKQKESQNDNKLKQPKKNIENEDEDKD